MKLVNVLVMLFAMNACSQKQKIVITREYITNEYWKEAVSSFFVLEKMKVKQDSVLNIFAPSFKYNISNHTNVTKKLETDSSFIFTYSAGLNRKSISETIYFNKKNDGDWHTGGVHFTGKRKQLESIGNLEANTWYRFSKLRDVPFFIYVFVDSVGEIHPFEQNLSNF